MLVKDAVSKNEVQGGNFEIAVNFMKSVQYLYQQSHIMAGDKEMLDKHWVDFM